MDAIVIYESLTGNTRTAAANIAAGLREAGVGVEALCPVTAVDYDALSRADLVVLGSWTDGIFVVGQRPGRAARLRKLPAMRGKKAVAFCTYALNPGHTVEKIMDILDGRGADAIGGLAIHRRDLVGGAQDLVDRLTAALDLRA